mmetsp:Transcript_99640/g.307342  ORF Transcript_99640/g.307342 Transcript_99640/m.307342 type:complete len:230 (-) Transcript_99640:176-865(-)
MSAVPDRPVRIKTPIHLLARVCRVLHGERLSQHAVIEVFDAGQVEARYDDLDGFPEERGLDLAAEGAPVAVEHVPCSSGDCEEEHEQCSSEDHEDDTDQLYECQTRAENQGVGVSNQPIHIDTWLAVSGQAIQGRVVGSTDVHDTERERVAGSELPFGHAVRPPEPDQSAAARLAVIGVTSAKPADAAEPEEGMEALAKPADDAKPAEGMGTAAKPADDPAKTAEDVHT